MWGLRRADLLQLEVHRHSTRLYLRQKQKLRGKDDLFFFVAFRSFIHKRETGWWKRRVRRGKGAAGRERKGRLVRNLVHTWVLGQGRVVHAAPEGSCMQGFRKSPPRAGDV